MPYQILFWPNALMKKKKFNQMPYQEFLLTECPTENNFFDRMPYQHLVGPRSKNIFGIKKIPVGYLVEIYLLVDIFFWWGVWNLIFSR